MTKLIRFCAFCLTLLTLAPPTSAQENPRPVELVGSYFAGHRYGGSRLTLKPDGHYIMESSDCTMAYVNSGRYSVSDGVLSFTILKDTARSFGGGKTVNLLNRKERKKFYGDEKPDPIDTRFLLRVITWGQRVYLMEEDRMASFARAINLGIEPRENRSYEPWFGSFYLREGDEARAVTGHPSLPAEQLRFILEKPITATITSISTEDNQKIATLDRGSKDGLQIEMYLVPEKDEVDYVMSLQTYWVFSLDETSAKVRIYGPVSVGDKLTTKATRLPLMPS